MNERIRLDMSLIDIVKALSEGNPGAINVMMMAMTESEIIDPDDAFKEFGLMMHLDMCGIYGSRIWLLFKDVCKTDIEKMIAVLRSCQLGFISQSTLNSAIDNYGEGIDVDDLVKQVKVRLPNFGRKTSTPEPCETIVNEVIVESQQHFRTQNKSHVKTKTKHKHKNTKMIKLRISNRRFIKRLRRKNKK